MRRLLLYSLMSVVLLAGEPAVGATLDLPLPARAADPGALFTPLLRIVGVLTVAPDSEPLAGGATLSRREAESAPVLEVRDHEVLAVGVRANTRGERASLEARPADRESTVPTSTDP
jgi:hypothetical protein